jgi:hypothetical protein
MQQQQQTPTSSCHEVPGGTRFILRGLAGVGKSAPISNEKFKKMNIRWRFTFVIFLNLCFAFLWLRVHMEKKHISMDGKQKHLC